MEMTCDWRGFQTLFHPQKKSGAIPAGSLSGGSVSGVDDALRAGPAYLVVDGDRIVTAFADHEDLSEWVGATTDEVRSQASHRELVIFDRGLVDQCLKESFTQARYYDQIETLRKSARAGSPSSDAAVPTLSRGTRRHFLLEAMHGWWGKLLPNAYGVFVRVGGRGATGPNANGGIGANNPFQEQDFLLIVRRGALESFHQPDLSGLATDRRRNPNEIIRFLTGRYFVPIQGVFVSAAEWNDWAHQRDPWRPVMKSLRSKRAKLVPSRWGVKSLIGFRALTGF